MDFPPVFETIKTPAVLALLKDGAGDIRVYPFGYAKQPIQKPYAVWQTVGGSPENYLGNRPDADNWSIQVDIYADSSNAARDIYIALRDAIEPVAHILGNPRESRDPVTMNYRLGFDCEFWTRR